MEITLRDASVEDEGLLLEIYSSTRAKEMALVSWSDPQKEAFVKMQFQAQDADYHKRYPQADYKVIMREGEPIGRIYIHRDTDRINILDVSILPKYRNTGIGTNLIQTLLAEAAQSGKSVRIYVETFNRSLGLFERLGFSKIEEAGVNYLLEWRPPKLEYLEHPA